MLKRLQSLILLCSVVFSVSTLAETQVVILGTGTPVPDADRSGPSAAVIYNGEAYIFDVGGGMVQRAIEASEKLNIPALYPTNIKHLFLTHLHSDHILDYPELASTYWWRRSEALTVHGPVGVKKMAQGFYDMLSVDIELRTDGHQPMKDPELYKSLINEHEKGGGLYKKGELTIEAFDVPHGAITPAFGYKITTPDKSIVISGDTSYSDIVAEKAKGVDVLVHEVINEKGLRKLSPFWQKYHSSSHTLSSELGKLAAKAKPKVVVLTHILYYGAPIETTVDQVKEHFSGDVVLANDLDVF